MALNYGILLNTPKEIPIAIKQHEKLSIIGLSSFMVNYPICIADKGKYIIIYCPEHKGNYYHTMPMFKEVIPGKINPSVELAWFKVPKTTKLFKTINKYFKHLYLKKG